MTAWVPRAAEVFVRCDRRADRRRSGRTGRALHRQRRRTSAAERRRATVERRGEHVEVKGCERWTVTSG